MREAKTNTTRAASGGAIAYVLKGYPRLSEMFITSEIFRLEQLGVRLRLHVIKPADETRRQGIINRIKARPDYLPATTSLSNTPLRRWLSRHLKDFMPALRHVARRRPAGVARAAVAALAQAARARRTFWSPPRKVYLKEFLQAAAVASRVLDDVEVKHLHAHFSHGATTVAWLASMMTGLPFSFTAHAKDIYCESLNPAGLLARKMRAARFVTTCTDANREHLLKVEPRAAVHCVYHGLNAEFAGLLDQTTPEQSINKTVGAGLVPARVFAKRSGQGRARPLQPSSTPEVSLDALHRVTLDQATPDQTATATTTNARPLSQPARPLRALGVGRLVEKKGFDVLVEACGILRRQGVAVEALIVGESGEHEAQIRRRIVELDLGAHVRLAGPMEQARLYEEYRRAGAFCLPCRVLDNGDRDGIPNVLVEAMACGVPVVTTAVCGIPEIVSDGVNGQLVPPDDPQALADALQRLAREPLFASRLASAGRETVRERFDGDRFAAQLAALFREVTG
jgi:glycosyltransferase involved in cell wall biosynthesis